MILKSGLVFSFSVRDRLLSDQKLGLRPRNQLRFLKATVGRQKQLHSGGIFMQVIVKSNFSIFSMNGTLKPLSAG